MAEIELSHLSRQCLGGRIAAKATLINQVQAEHPTEREACQGPLAVYDR